MTSLCDNEPINTPGTVQPHGVLLSLDNDHRIVQTSENVEAILGSCVADVLGKHPSALLACEAGLEMQDILRAAAAGEPKRAQGCVAVVHGNMSALELCVHRHNDITMMELEPVIYAPPSAQGWLSQLESCLDAMTQAPTVQLLADTLTQCVRNVSQFERVMVYQFDADWNGSVLSEAKTPEVASYLGQQFPASDIPPQARKVFSENWSRAICDVHAPPAKLQPTFYPQTNLPLDIGRAHLRSASPIHLQYLMNMQVQASLTISVIVNGKLWGLVACHNTTPKRIPFAARHLCEILGRFASSRIDTLRYSETTRTRADLRKVNTALRNYLTSAVNFGVALTEQEPNLLALLPRHRNAGAVVLGDDTWRSVGVVPTLPELQALCQWLHTRFDDKGLYATDDLVTQYPPAAKFADRASGLLAFIIDKKEPTYVLWLLPEVVRTIDWAGRPEKVVANPGESAMLHPRHSFALWRETVHQRALPISEVETRAVLQLRQFMLENDLQRQVSRERLVRLQLQSERLRLRLLFTATVALGHQLDLRQAMQSLAQAVVQSFCPWCVIYLKEGHSFVRYAMAHATPPGRTVYALWEMPAAQSDYLPASLLAGQTMHWPRTDNSRLEGLITDAAHVHYIVDKLSAASIVISPLLARNTVVGYIGFVRYDRANPFLPQDIDLATQLAIRAASAADNAVAHARIKQALMLRDQVLGVVSHDLRNPLGVVRLTAEKILRDVKKNALQKVAARTPDAMQKVLACVQRMEILIADLLNMGKIESDHLLLDQRPYACADLAAEAKAQMHMLAAHAKVGLRVVGGDAALYVRCDAARIAQVFGNLIANAIKFSKPGQQVTITWAAREDGNVEFSVSDCGVGMPPEHLERVFERFWQAQNRQVQGGAGLGLAIVKSLVEAHGGRAGVESRVGEGSRFFFSLAQVNPR